MGTVLDLHRHRTDTARLAQIEAALAFLVRSIFPATLLALRAAAVTAAGHKTPHGKTEIPSEAAAARSVSNTHENETPGAATPGASGMPTPVERSRAMQTLPHVPVTATPIRPLAEVGTAQHTALIRWFSDQPIGDVMDALHAHPTFPLLSCNEQARAFAPSRGMPRPAA